MPSPTPKPLTPRGPRALLVLALLGAAACHDAGPAAPEAEPTALRSVGFFDDRGAEPFKVLTRNVYLGGNTGLVFTADFSNPVSVITAGATVWGQVRSSNIPSRAAAIVDEIEAARPHLVSLQEAFRFQSTGGLVIDWLDAIEAEIALRGLPYRLEAVQDGTVATLPVSPTELVSFRDRIALLVREDVATGGLAQGKYAAKLPLVVGHPIVGNVIIERGWIRFDTDVDGVPYHLVATHLETQGIRPIHDAQGAELLASVAADLDGVTIIAGDLNSDAAATSGPSWTPTYGLLTAAGFADAWLHSAASRPSAGFTCCQATDLMNADSELDQRLDLVMLRVAGPYAANLAGAVAADVVGDEQGDRLTSGLWPSDHAGLLAAFRLPSGVVSDQ